MSCTCIAVLQGFVRALTSAEVFVGMLAAMAMTSSAANDVDVRLGRQWAKCSAQAGIIQKIYEKRGRVEAAEKMKEISDVLYIYATVAAGSGAIESERLSAEMEFIRSPVDQDTAKMKIAAISLFKRMQMELSDCSLSLSANGDRFERKIEELRGNLKTYRR